MEHELKCWPEFYDAIASGEKTFEIRKNDRGYQKGDVLVLRKWDPKVPNMPSIHPVTYEPVPPRGGYVGNTESLRLSVTYVLGGEMLAPGYVVIGFKIEVRR